MTTTYEKRAINQQQASHNQTNVSSHFPGLQKTHTTDSEFTNPYTFPREEKSLASPRGLRSNRVIGLDALRLLCQVLALSFGELSEGHEDAQPEEITNSLTDLSNSLGGARIG
eukprot:6469806-Amphidinium_carterae.1